MINFKVTKLRYPPAFKNHRLFGERYVVRHLFGTKNWTPKDLANQYKCMTDILTKHNELLKLKQSIKYRKQRQKIVKLKQEISKKRAEINQLRTAKDQTIRNVLQDNREILRLCTKLSIEQIDDYMKQKLFLKRKEYDRLSCQLKMLSEEYENKLREYSEQEDQLLYPKEFIMPEQEKTRKIRVELTNTQTRIKAIRTIKRTYTNIIQFLMQDAVYYNFVLDALQSDIDEQQNFINKIMELVTPVTKELPKLIEKHKLIKDRQKRKIKLKVNELKEFKTKLISDREEAMKQIHNDTDFVKLDHNRYAKETPSIINLKKEVDDFEEVVRKIQFATNCSEIKELVKVVKAQSRRNSRLKKIIDLYENEKEILEEKEAIATKIQQSLDNNYSKEEAERIWKIQELNEQIAEEKKTQNEINNYLKEKGEIIVLLTWAMDHINDTLRNVGEQLTHPQHREYPNEDLKLPLLNFDMYLDIPKPPHPFETNLEKLVDSASRKITYLMGLYYSIPQDQLENIKKMYNVHFSNNFNPKMIPQKRLTVDEQKKISSDDEEYDDPDVLRRTQIKLMSSKIVEENTKND